MIEQLAIAAEITAVLLVLSLVAIPKNAPKGKRESVTGDCDGMDFGSTEFQEKIDELRYSWHSWLIHSYWSINQHLLAANENPQRLSLASDSFESMREEQLKFQRFLWGKQFDTLHLMPGRAGAEEFVERFDRLVQKEVPGISSCQMALVEVSNHADLVDTHGLVAAERATQVLRNLLVSQFGIRGLICRYSTFRFALVFVGIDQEWLRNEFSKFQNQMVQEGFTFNEKPVQIFTGMSLLLRQHGCPHTDLWDTLEEGLASIGHAPNHSIAELDSATGSWISQTSPNVAMNSEFAATLQNRAPNFRHPSDSDSQDPIGTEEDDIEPPLLPVEEEAEVVSSTDIEALFQAARNQESFAPTLPKEQSIITDSQPSTEPQQENTSNSGTVTASDIESLFEQSKAATKKTT